VVVGGTGGGALANTPAYIHTLTILRELGLYSPRHQVTEAGSGCLVWQVIQPIVHVPFTLYFRDMLPPASTFAQRVYGSAVDGNTRTRARARARTHTHTHTHTHT
jgi:hypothetical protein